MTRGPNRTRGAAGRPQLPRGADTVAVCAQDDAVRQVDAPSGVRYTADPKTGLMHMLPGDAAALVKTGGVMPSLAKATRRSTGYRCGTCGFGSYFKTCGRCESECEREA